MNDSLSITLILRDKDSLFYQEVANEWQAMLMLGPISADPRSFEEFTEACTRYLQDDELESMAWHPLTSQGDFDNWILIDLAHQRLVANSEEGIPISPEIYEPTEEEVGIGTPVVWINLPAWWECSIVQDWRAALEVVAPTEDEDPLEEVDFRKVLFGSPFAEALAKGALGIDKKVLPKSMPTVDEDDPNISDDDYELHEEWRELTVKVHADWLMTPRADLAGSIPRDFLHRNREWKAMEIQYRQHQWSMLRQPPPAIDTDSHLYRLGPMGIDEVVVYFDLCRAMIGFAWKCIVEQKIRDHEKLSVLLTEFNEDWMENGKMELEPCSPIAIVESERRLLPRTADRTHIDCDCPLCQMVDETGGPSGQPMFTAFDGSHLMFEDNFAFSLHDDIDEWEEMQEELDSFDDQLDEQIELQELEPGEGAEFETVWKSSRVYEEPSGKEDPQLAMLKLAFRLSELVSDLQDRKAPRDEIEGLNGSFNVLRQSLNLGIDPLAASRSLIDQLEQLATRHPELTGKSADLQSTIDQWSRDKR